MTIRNKRTLLLSVYFIILLLAVADLGEKCSDNCTRQDFVFTAGIMFLVVLVVMWFMYKK